MLCYVACKRATEVIAFWPPDLMYFVCCTSDSRALDLCILCYISSESSLVFLFEFIIPEVPYMRQDNPGSGGKKGIGFLFMNFYL